jgi:hypothetical protein
MPTAGLYPLVVNPIPRFEGPRGREQGPPDSERDELREALPMKSRERLRTGNPPDEPGAEQRDERSRPIPIDEDVEGELNAALPEPATREEEPSREE